MAYIVFHTTAFLNEDDTSSMTAAALKAAGITSVKGYGGIDVPVNSEGYLKNPAQHLPDGMLDKLKRAWTSSNGDANAFFNQNIDGTPVKDILAQCPSQQSYGIAKELGLPDGTAVPCKEFTDHDYQHIKYDSGSSVPPSSGTDAAGADAADSVADAGADAGAGAADSGSAGAGAGDWWAFFGSKEFLIGAVAVAGVIALIKALGNTIKARFRKCAKVLYRMQKDFGTKQNGMDMKAVLPGVGSKIMDWLGRLWGSKAGNGKNKGALGLRPFVDNYRNELSADYQEARKAFNMIATAGKGIDGKKKGKEQTSGKMNNLQSESQTVIYSSFSEMLKSEPLNEEETALNEALGVGAIVALGSVAIKGGMYLFSKKDKNGNDVDSPKAVQVTRQSTREICYSILNMFFSKYFNMKAVSEKMGMNVDSLGDIDKSNVDKFAKLAQAMKQEQASGKGSKMYARVEKNYNQMVDAYVRIANSVVNNFEKYTKNSKGKDGKVKELSEKDSNLLVASVEKLRAEVNRQEDGYRNNFFRVVNAIITSPEYTTYLDFIIKDVIPVFKTGLASDADFVLDIVPKAGEYYILQQTNRQTDNAEAGAAKENTVLAKVIGFDQSEKNAKNPIIKFARVALLKDPGTLTLTNGNEYDMSRYSEDNLDRTVYGKAVGQTAEQEEGGDEVTLTYDKWMALNPIIALNVPGAENKEEIKKVKKVYTRKVEVTDASTGEKKEQEQFIVILPNGGNEAKEYNEDTRLNEEGEAKSEEQAQPTENEVVKSILFVSGGNKKLITIADNNTNLSDFDAFVKTSDEDKLKSMGFAEAPEEVAKTVIEKADELKQGAEEANVNTKEDIPGIINGKIEPSEEGTTGSEGLSKVVDKLAQELSTKLQSLKLDSFKAGTAGSYVYQGNDLAVIPDAVGGKFKAGIPIPTGVKTSTGKDIVIMVKPYATAKPGSNEQPSQDASTNANAQQPARSAQDSSTNNNQSQQTAESLHEVEMAGSSVQGSGSPTSGNNNQVQNTSTSQKPQPVIGAYIILAVKNEDGTYSGSSAASNKAGAVSLSSKFDVESVKAAITSLVNMYKTYAANDASKARTIEESNITVEYDKYFNIAESFMSSFGFNGANKLHVNRTIKAPKSKLTYYALSENAWGDGSKLDPEKYIKESLDAILAKNSTYDEFAKLAKSSHTINLIKIDEDCSYNTALPYNRYQMLTAANPLYEGLVVVRFDKRGKLVEAIRLGVKKIYCETV